MGHQKRVGTVIGAELHRAAEAECEATGESMSGLLRAALARMLSERGRWGEAGTVAAATFDVEPGPAPDPMAEWNSIRPHWGPWDDGGYDPTVSHSRSHEARARSMSSTTSSMHSSGPWVRW